MGSILSLIIVVLLLVKATFDVLLLILAASLIGVFFKGISGLLHRKTGWKTKITLPVSNFGVLVIIVLLFWLVGSKVESQSDYLIKILPQTVENAKQYLNQSSLGKKILQKVSSPQAQEGAQQFAQSFFKTTFGVFGDIYVVLFLGIFFTVGASAYKQGMIAMIPQGGEKKASDVLDKIAENLKKWMKGQFFAMFVVFVLTATGLAIIGIPLWLVLALIAGMLNFIPNFGPLIAMVPAILVALMESPTKAALVAGVYIFVQVAESNFVTPLVQKKLLNTPPAMIIIAQLLMATLTGGWGIILAIPFLVVVMTLVQELYIKTKHQRA
ncbi:MAG: AI-2E family transporter [Chitinophagaceae bacterium]